MNKFLFLMFCFFFGLGTSYILPDELAVEYFTFSSDSHKFYFIVTVANVGASIVLGIVGYGSLSKSMLGSYTVYMLSQALLAYCVVIVWKMNTSIYTTHCIWYNALLGCLCFVAYLVLRRGAMNVTQPSVSGLTI
ncbi:MAG: hypothetical protein NUV82_01985 [Candidatus Komeilibacteria bacterium]|nr:hypothetical protein [Candidatus Komeilibacteria bacterium]